MSDCDWTRTHLAPLRYGDLAASDERRVLEHVASCGSCREALEEIDAVGGLLDEVPLERADPGRALGLKQRVLEAVDALPACSREHELFSNAEDPEHLAACASCRDAQRAFTGVGRALDTLPAPALAADVAADLKSRILAAVACEQEPLLLLRETLSPTEAAALVEHVQGCGSCQSAEAAFREVEAALDLVPVPAPNAERWGSLKERVVSEVAPAPAGRVLRFPAFVSRLAAAFLAAATLGLAGYVVLDDSREVSRLARLEREAGMLVRSGDPSMIAPAITRYEEIARSSDPVMAARGRTEAKALRLVVGHAAPAILAGQDPTETTQTILISYQDVIVEFPGTRASLYGIKQAFPQPRTSKPLPPKRSRPHFDPRLRDPFSYPYKDLVTEGSQLAQFLETRLQQRPKILRFDYANMRKLVQPKMLLDVGLRQSILLQQGMHAEELSVIASARGARSEQQRYRAEARQHYEGVLSLGANTKAARLAQEALERLA